MTRKISWKFVNLKLTGGWRGKNREKGGAILDTSQEGC